MSSTALRSADLPRPSLRGTAWLSLRQERTTLLLGGGVLLLVCAWALGLGLAIDHWITANGLQGCNEVYFPPECTGRYDREVSIPPWWPPAVVGTGWVLVLLPVALGLFVGAPLLAREFESGSYRLAWTQSVSRTRWLAGRLAAPLLLTLLGSSLLAVVSSWFAGVVQGRFGVPGYYHWFTWMARSTHGTASVGFCLLGLTLGLTVGLVVRRVVAAIAVTAVLTALLRLTVDQLRYLFAPALESLAPVQVTVLPARSDQVVRLFQTDFPAHSPLESDLLEVGYRSSDGYRISELGSWPPSTMPDGRLLCQAQGCLDHPDITHAYALYHPPSDVWAVMWTQTGLCLGLAALLIGFCFLRVRRMR
ncbi:ABC transporter permease subunit [Kitasatospora sp. NPDC096147]|uniref:ABC transporter permease subunit n=1 Tax=Kitasatospora sp. NPDC096147 TaxID=3364093 RepID=UPI00381FF043